MKGDETLPPGVGYFGKLLSTNAQGELLCDIEAVIKHAPLYLPTMPRTGKPFSVWMTNCGTLGWVSDKDGGYRYQGMHPITGERWPNIPECLLTVWDKVTQGAPAPEACLVNVYGPKARLGSHVDRDEEDLSQPVVSISLGDTASFHVGGKRRSDAKCRALLTSGDVVVLAGEARLLYHGVDRVYSGTSDLCPRHGRINLTLRRVNWPYAGPEPVTGG